MKFSVAVRGAEVSKDIGCCDAFLIFEEKHGKIIMRQIIENPGYGPSLLPGFLEEFRIEAFLCGGMDEQAIQAFAGKDICVVGDLSGSADKIAEEFALKRCNSPICNPAANLRPRFSFSAEG